MKVLRMNVNMTLPEGFVWNLPSGRNDYLFVLFKSPSMLVVNGEKIPVDNGDAVLLDKYTPQKYYPVKGEFVHDFIHFDYDNESERKEFDSIPFSTVIHISDINEVSDILRLILHYFIMNSSEEKDIVYNLGRAFLHTIKNNIHSVKNIHFKELQSLRTEIYRNPQFSWSVEYMARKVALNKSQLQALYRDTFGISCVNDVINSRIEMAKRLLGSTDIMVCQTAELCGYKNAEHFIRQFKAKEGVTPNQFRRIIGDEQGKRE